ncbi:MAG: YraN family protein [Pseudomonadota bacterium]
MPHDTRQRAERKGRQAEWFAILSYLLRFYWPIAIRARTRAGEIDLVLRRRQMLVFAEVKYRSHLDEAAFALTARQQQRIARAAASFLSSRPHFSRFVCRFDVVCVAPWQWPRHVENAFLAAP